MKYVSLHHHSTYSYLDGYALPEAHVRRAGDLEMGALALTEHGNTSSHVKLELAAKAAGVKPLYGCELYTGATDAPVKRKNHLTVLAENLEGYRNLLRVVSKGWENFYYEPTVDGRTLRDHREGLVILSGCTGSLLATSLVGGKNIKPEDASFDRGYAVAQRFKQVFGDSYYLEVQTFPELEATRNINQALERIGRELHIPLVATGDVHYTKPEENEMQKILHAVRPGGKQTVEEQARAWGYDVLLCPPTTDKRVYSRLRATGLSQRAAHEAIANTAEIAERCTVVLPHLDRLRYPLPDGYSNAREIWLQWLREGWNYRNIDARADRARYAERIKYEMKIIEDKDFIDYFLVVSDIVKYAKDHGIPVGPARGSAAASLVCYLLRITEVDPLLFASLVFERFIDVTRADLPDIDLDFDDERRYQVREYIVTKYGSAYVGNIGTFTTYKSKNSLDDIARVYRVPKWEVDNVKELMLERSSGDLRASATIEDTVKQFPEAKAVFDRWPDLYKAMQLEGNIRGMGVHAAGVVIANKPITDYCAVYTREVAGIKQEVISLDKYDAERINMLKVDILGLNTMGMVRIALELIGMKLQDLYDLSLDDPEVLAGFQENDLTGIFQFEGRSTRLVNADLHPDNFNELCVVNALSRPGPLNSGSATRYVEIKKGINKYTPLHPVFDEIVATTNGQVIYQEQILRIVREIGNFDWTSASYIRKIISKSIGEQEFNRQWSKFWKGAKQHGLDEQTAQHIWGMCITAGSYGFNAAHAVSYTMLAYWSMWLKRKHPLAFYVAALRKYGNVTSGYLKLPKRQELLRDAAKHGIKILPPDPNASEAQWSAADGALLAGFMQVPGIGEKVAHKIMDYRMHHDGPVTWEDLTAVHGIGPKTAERIQAFVSSKDPFEVYTLQRKMRIVTKAIKRGTLRQRSGALLPIPTHTSETVPFGKGKTTEIVWMGIVALRNLRDVFEFYYARTGKDLDPSTIRDPQLTHWMTLQCMDNDGILALTIDRWKYPRFKEVIWNIDLGKDIILIRGIKKGQVPQKIVYVSELWVIR